MKILLITDIHYGADVYNPKLKGEGYINMFGSQFDRFVPHLRALTAEHDLTVNLGDLIREMHDGQDTQRYEQALTLFGSKRPVLHVAGNHDLNTVSREHVAGMLKTARLYYSVDIGGYHHVVLDSLRDSKSEPHRIDAEQLQWLAGDLQRTAAPTLVYCHCPLDEQSLDSNYYFHKTPEKGFISNRKDVRAILEHSGKVLAVFGGHVHFYHQERINHITYVTVPSFSENDGGNKPQAEVLSASLRGNMTETQVIKL